MIPKPPLSQVNAALFDYKTNSKDEREYHDVCEKCKKEFTFKMKDVKDRVIKCPYCNADMVFFSFKYR